MTIQDIIDVVIDKAEAVEAASLHHLDMVMLLGDEKSAAPEYRAYVDARHELRAVRMTAATYGIPARLIDRAVLAGQMSAQLKNTTAEGMLF